MTFRWPWHKRADKGSGAMRKNNDIDSRLAAAVRASEQSEKLIARVHQLSPVVEAHTNVSRRFRQENGFAYLMYEQAFKGRE
jgi:hypothetical protein